MTAVLTEAGGWRIVDDPDQWILQQTIARGRAGGVAKRPPWMARYFSYKPIVERCLREDGADAEVIAALTAALPPFHPSRPGPLPARPRARVTGWPSPAPRPSAAPTRNKRGHHVSGAACSTAEAVDAGG